MKTNRRLLYFVAAFMCSMALCGNALAFRSTQTESYTDPDYKDFKPKKVVIVVLNASNEVRKIIEDRLADRLSDYGVEALKERELFPPTREWTTESRVRIMATNGVDSVLIVAVGENSSSVQTVGQQTFGSTNMSGTVSAAGGINSVGNSNSTSYNIVLARSKADFSAVLMDTTAARTAWYADVTTKASGTLFVGDKGDAKGAVKGVIDALATDGHIKKK